LSDTIEIQQLAMAGYTIVNGMWQNNKRSLWKRSEYM
jgi:hypothetical protein